MKIKLKDCTFVSDISGKILLKDDMYSVDDKLMSGKELLAYCKITPREVIDSINKVKKVKDDDKTVEENPDNVKMDNAELKSYGIDVDEETRKKTDGLYDSFMSLAMDYKNRYGDFNSKNDNLNPDYDENDITSKDLETIFLEIVYKVVKLIVKKSWSLADDKRERGELQKIGTPEDLTQIVLNKLTVGNQCYLNRPDFESRGVRGLFGYAKGIARNMIAPKVSSLLSRFNSYLADFIGVKGFTYGKNPYELTEEQRKKYDKVINRLNDGKSIDLGDGIKATKENLLQELRVNQNYLGMVSLSKSSNDDNDESDDKRAEWDKLGSDQVYGGEFYGLNADPNEVRKLKIRQKQFKQAVELLKSYVKSLIPAIRTSRIVGTTTFTPLCIKVILKTAVLEDNEELLKTLDKNNDHLDFCEKIRVKARKKLMEYYKEIQDDENKKDEAKNVKTALSALAKKADANEFSKTIIENFAKGFIAKMKLEAENGDEDDKMLYDLVADFKAVDISSAVKKVAAHQSVFKNYDETEFDKVAATRNLNEIQKYLIDNWNDVELRQKTIAVMKTLSKGKDAFGRIGSPEWMTEVKQALDPSIADKAIDEIKSAGDKDVAYKYAQF